MKLRNLVLVLVGLGLIVGLNLTTGCGSSTKSGKSLVKMSGEDITEGDLAFLGDMNPRLKAQLDNPAMKRQLLDKLVEQELLYREALKRGLQRDKETKAKIELYRRVIVASAALDDEIKKESKKYYDANQDEFKKLKMSHIMIRYATPADIENQKKSKRPLPKDAGWMTRTEQQAMKLATDIKAKLDKGEKFEDVAKEYSEDPLSKQRGGDLGAVGKGEKRMEARGFGALVEKAYELKVDEVAGPIKTDKGYHIIMVTKAAELEPYEDAEEKIMATIRGKTKNDLIEKLKKEEEVVYVEDEKPAEQAPAASAPVETNPAAAGQQAAPAGVVTKEANAAEAKDKSKETK